MSKLTDDNRTWLLSFVSGQKFFNSRLKDSVETEKMYTYRLKQYCDEIGKNPNELLKMKPSTFELLAMMQKGIDVSTISETEAKDTLELFLSKDTIFDKESGEQKPFTVYSKLGFLTAIKSFYSANDRDLPKSTCENLEAPEAKKRSPTVDDCLKLENAMTNSRDKFLIWFLESCPVRKGTLYKLKWKDLKPLDDKLVPFWLSIESLRLKGKGLKKYKGSRHIGFIHSYANEKLQDYIKELEARKISYTQESPLFMCYYQNAYGSKVGDALRQINSIIQDASIVAFGDDVKKHFSPHDFRDVLSTVIGKLKTNDNLAKPLTSHKPLHIESTYENHPDSDYLELFKLCIPFLIPETIGELKTELNQTESTVKKLSEQNKEQSKILSEAMTTLDEVLTQLEKEQKEMEKYKAMFERIGKSNPDSKREQSLKKLRENQPQ